MRLLALALLQALGFWRGCACLFRHQHQSSRGGHERPHLSSCLNIQSVNLMSCLVCVSRDHALNLSEEDLGTINQQSADIFFQ